MSNAVGSAAVVVKIGDGGGPENFTTIAEVKDIDGPGFTRSIIDVTSHDSAGWKEKRPGLKDAGQLSFEINFIKSNSTQGYVTGLLHDYANDVLRNFRFTFPDASYWAITAIVKDFQPKAPVDGVITAKISLEITGQPTLN